MTPNELDQLEAIANAYAESDPRVRLVPRAQPEFQAFNDYTVATSPESILALIAELRVTRRALEMATANPYNYAGWQKPSDWLSKARKELETK